jgi:Family of unknown function (DUF6185)
LLVWVRDHVERATRNSNLRAEPRPRRSLTCSVGIEYAYRAVLGARSRVPIIRQLATQTRLEVVSGPLASPGLRSPQSARPHRIGIGMSNRKHRLKRSASGTDGSECTEISGESIAEVAHSTSPQNSSNILRLFLLLGLLAAIAFVGGLRGAAINKHDTVRSFSSADQRACSETDAMHPVEVTTIVDFHPSNSADLLGQQVLVNVPTDWWEVDALRSPTTDANNRSSAMICLFDTWAPNLEPEFSSTNGYTSIRVRALHSSFASDHSSCGTLLRTEVHYRVLIFSYAPLCNKDLPSLLTSSETLHKIRLHPNGARSTVHPPPIAENGESVEWSWVGVAAAPTDLTVNLHLSLVTYSEAYFQNGPSATILGQFTLFPGASTYWSIQLIVALLFILILATAGLDRRLIWHICLLIGLLYGGLIFQWSSSKLNYNFAIAVTPLSSIGLAAVVISDARRRLPVAIFIGSTLCLGLGASRSTSFGSNAYMWAAAGALCGGMVLSVLVVRSMATWMAQAGPITGTPWRRSRLALFALVAAAVSYSLGFETGAAVDGGDQPSVLFRMLDLPYIAAAFMVPALSAIGIRVVLLRWDAEMRSRSMLLSLGACWGLVASPSNVVVLGVAIPVGVPVLAAGLLILGRCPAVAANHFGLVPASELGNSATARALLNHGPLDDWRKNTRRMVEIGAIASIVPIAYFGWGVLDTLPSTTRDGGGSAYLAAAIVTEVARWLASAAVLGLLYTRLPGRTGPTKALSLSCLWFATSAIVELLSRWAGHSGGRAWTFPALQLLLYLVVVAVAYDYGTIRAANGGWADLQVVYGIDRTRQFAAFGVPATLAILAIAQQVASGTGIDFVKGVLENVPKLLSPGK